MCNTSCWSQLSGETLRSKWGMAASKAREVVARREPQHNRCYKARAPSTRSQSVRDFETMEKKYLLIFALFAVPSSGLPDISLNPRNNLTRNPSELKIFLASEFNFMIFQKHFRSSRLSNFPTWNAWQGVVQQLKAPAWQRKYFSFHQKNIFRQANILFWNLGLSKKIVVNFIKFSNGLSVQVWVHRQRRCGWRRLCCWIWGLPSLVFVALFRFCCPIRFLLSFLLPNRLLSCRH